MNNYIVEANEGVFNFYLPVEEQTIDGQTVMVKKLKFTKTPEQISSEIEKLDELIVKRQTETENYIININNQKTQKQAILALMV